MPDGIPLTNASVGTGVSKFFARRHRAPETETAYTGTIA